MNTEEDIEKVIAHVKVLEKQLDVPPRKHNCSDAEDINKIVEEGMHLERILEDNGDEEE
jgi:hypothetical protein